MFPMKIAIDGGKGPFSDMFRCENQGAPAPIKVCPAKASPNASNHHHHQQQQQEVQVTLAPHHWFFVQPWECCRQRDLRLQGRGTWARGNVLQAPLKLWTHKVPPQKFCRGKSPKFEGQAKHWKNSSGSSLKDSLGRFLEVSLSL